MGPNVDFETWTKHMSFIARLVFLSQKDWLIGGNFKKITKKNLGEP